MNDAARFDLPPPQLLTDLQHAIREKKGCLRRFDLSQADVEDLCQDVLIRLSFFLAKGEPVRNLGALVSTSLCNAALDLLRARQRRREAPMDPEAFARALDEEGLRAASEESAAPRARAGVWELLGRDVDAYVARANQGRHPCGHHVRAWWRVRIEGESAAAVAAALHATSTAAVWQWCKRGRDRVLALARYDGDRARAERMMRAIEATQAAA